MPSINLEPIGTYTTGEFDEGAAEIVAHDSTTQRLFVVNGSTNRIDVLSIADPTTPTKEFDIDLSSFGDGPTSVAVSNGILAVTIPAADPLQPGQVAFFDADGSSLGSVNVGVLPDMLTFTPDGTRILVANEGEPADGGDPEGSVSIIDLSGGVGSATVTQVTFTDFNGREAELRDNGVRLFPDKTVAEDVEPEYIAVSPDGTLAYVTLQENNAIAVVDIAAGSVREILPLGTKNHSLPGNGLDASDRDGGINIQNYPVFGLYMPDAIAAYSVGGSNFYVTANEGDSRGEEERIGDLVLDPEAFPNAGELQQEDVLGRLEVSTVDGDLDGDGDYDQLFAYGSRSFTIWDDQGNLVFDSGDDFEQIIAAELPDYFNTSNDDNDSFDSRSDAKGPEPEGVTIGEIDGNFYAFIGLERVGGVMVYDVTDPRDAQFQQYINTRDFTGDAEAGTAGDLGPEGLHFIAAEDSPTGEAMLAVSNEISGSTSLYAVEPRYTLQILHASDLEGGVDAIGRAANFAAIVDNLEDTYENSITLSAGDNFIPGPFFNAAGDPSLRDVLQDTYETLYGLPADSLDLREGPGRADISIMNVLGFDASALGNHEFDTGTGGLASIIAPDIRDGGADVRWLGSQFPYLSANLDFSGDSELAPLFTSQLLPASDFVVDPAAPVATPKIAPATIIEENGERIGVVGATTPLLASISSPGGVEIKDPGAGTNDMTALATILQPVIDQLTADGIDKIILVTHLQQIQLEQGLVPLLSGVDVVIAGGSDTLLADSEDVARGLQPGDTRDGEYPIVATNKDGDPTLIVSTDGEYSYVGRLVVDFDANGVIITDSLDPNISGAFASTDEQVAALWGNEDPFAEGTKGDLVQDITEAVETIVQVQDSNIVGSTSVYLDGLRSEVRTEETNLGNLSADANLATAKDYDDTVMVSIKNGGGIRDSIGTVIETAPGVYEEVPPQANPEVGKEEGDISQLDIVNALRFNNTLTLVTLTPEQLLQVVEHAVSATAPGQTPGQFAQVGGIAYSFDPDLAAGDRILSLAVTDEAGSVAEVIVRDGEVVEDAPSAIRIVTLSFLADGGDGYPFPEFIDANPAFANRVELADVLTEPGEATFSAAGTEQDALAEYLTENYSETPYGEAETPPEGDSRIQNLDFREDTVLEEIEDRTFRGGFDDDSYKGGAGDDHIRGGFGDDSLDGSGGSDKIDGGFGDDVLDGGSGSDKLDGDIGDDALDGGQGSDKLEGGFGDDTLQGGAGADKIYGGFGDDAVDAGGGRDRVDGGFGDDVVDGRGGNDRLNGEFGDDVLDGGSGSDLLDGSWGDDTLLGGRGDDSLEGGWGRDVLNGGAGDDVLSGGRLGGDIFVFGDEVGLDTVTDFELRRDLLDVSDFDFIGFSDIASRISQNGNGDAVLTLNDEGTVVVTLTGIDAMSVESDIFTF